MIWTPPLVLTLWYPFDVLKILTNSHVEPYKMQLFLRPNENVYEFSCRAIQNTAWSSSGFVDSSCDYPESSVLFWPTVANFEKNKLRSKHTSKGSIDQPATSQSYLSTNCNFNMHPTDLKIE